MKSPPTPHFPAARSLGLEFGEEEEQVPDELAPHVLFHTMTRLLEQYMKVLQAHLCVLHVFRHYERKVSSTVEARDDVWLFLHAHSYPT